MNTEKTNKRRAFGLLGALLGVLVALVLCGTPAFAENETTDGTSTTSGTVATTDAAAATTDAVVADATAAADAATDAAAAAAAPEEDAAPAGTAAESFAMGNDVLWFNQDGQFKECIIANDLIGAGEKIAVSDAQIGGSIRMAGQSISLTNTMVSESITLAGQKLSVEGGSAHVVALAAQDIVFSGTTDKLYVGGSTVRIDGVVNGNVYVAADKLEIGPNAVITGTLKGKVGEEPTIAAEATIGANELELEKKTEQAEPADLFDWRVIVASVLNCMLVALLVEWLAGHATESASALIKERPGSYLLSGLLGMVVTPIVVVLLCIPVVTIPAAIALLLELIALALISSGFTAAVLARLILGKANRFVAAAIVGVVLGAALAMPYAGVPLRGVAYAFTLGYFLCAMRKHMADRRNKRNAEVIQF